MLNKVLILTMHELCSKYRSTNFFLHFCYKKASNLIDWETFLLLLNEKPKIQLHVATFFFYIFTTRMFIHLSCVCPSASHNVYVNIVKFYISKHPYICSNCRLLLSVKPYLYNPKLLSLLMYEDAASSLHLAAITYEDTSISPEI